MLLFKEEYHSANIRSFQSFILVFRLFTKLIAIHKNIATNKLLKSGFCLLKTFAQFGKQYGSQL